MLSEAKSLPALDSFKGCFLVRAYLMVYPLLKDRRKQRTNSGQTAVWLEKMGCSYMGEKKHFMCTFITVYCMWETLKIWNKSLHLAYSIFPSIKLLSFHELSRTQEQMKLKWVGLLGAVAFLTSSHPKVNPNPLGNSSNFSLPWI